MTSFGVRAAVVVAITGSSLAVAGFAASSASAKSRVSFGIEPASASKPDARPNLDIGATPAARLSDHVAVLNYSAQPLRLQVYATDAVNTATGGFSLLPQHRKPVDVGSWVAIPRRFSTVNVPAAVAGRPGRVIVPVAISVPATASPGDHVGGVVASLRTVGQNTSGQNVVLDQRIATRLFVRVAGELHPALTISNVHTHYDGTLNPVGHGGVTVSYDIRNAGNVSMGVREAVSAASLFGSKSAAPSKTVPLLLPGDTLHESAHVGGIWPQIFDHAVVTATPLAPQGGSDPGLAPQSVWRRVWAVPWPLISLLALLAAVAFGYRRYLSDRVRAFTRRPGRRHREATA
ncbi:MAG: hypothetical protein JO214_16890 [Frankiaceae bacterium]|nr:hypothetical protein [Frankiaceae bacterium]